jgi:intracellular septation protein
LRAGSGGYNQQRSLLKPQRMNHVNSLAPTLAFFAAYYFGGIYVAVAVLMGVMLLTTAFEWLRAKKPPKVSIAMTALICVLGALTLWLRDPSFIKFKPTAIYGAFSLALLGSHLIGDKVLMARMPQQMIALPDPVWRRVNFAWAVFFAVCAILNLYVAANYSEAAWVKFKTFGFTALMFAFMLAHAPFLSRYVTPDDAR